MPRKERLAIAGIDGIRKHLIQRENNRIQPEIEKAFDRRANPTGQQPILINRGLSSRLRRMVASDIYRYSQSPAFCAIP